MGPVQTAQLAVLEGLAPRGAASLSRCDAAGLNVDRRGRQTSSTRRCSLPPTSSRSPSPKSRGSPPPALRARALGGWVGGMEMGRRGGVSLSPLIPALSPARCGAWCGDRSAAPLSGRTLPAEPRDCVCWRLCTRAGTKGLAQDERHAKGAPASLAPPASTTLNAALVVAAGGAWGVAQVARYHTPTIQDKYAQILRLQERLDALCSAAWHDFLAAVSVRCARSSPPSPPTAAAGALSRYIHQQLQRHFSLQADGVRGRRWVRRGGRMGGGGGWTQLRGAAGAGTGAGGAGLPLLAGAGGEAGRVGTARDAAGGAHGGHHGGPAPHGGGHHRRPLRPQRRLPVPRRAGLPLPPSALLPSSPRPFAVSSSLPPPPPTFTPFRCIPFRFPPTHPPSRSSPVPLSAALLPPPESRPFDFVCVRACVRACVRFSGPWSSPGPTWAARAPSSARPPSSSSWPRSPLAQRPHPSAGPPASRRAPCIACVAASRSSVAQIGVVAARRLGETRESRRPRRRGGRATPERRA